MRISSLASAFVALALLSAGCKKASPIVGKWNASSGGGTVDLDFKPEGTFSLAVKAGAFGMTSSGDYKLEGERLSLTTKDVQMPGLSPALLAKAKASPEFGKPKDMTVKFVSDDEISVSGLQPAGAVAGQTATLKRVKEGS